MKKILFFLGILSLCINAYAGNINPSNWFIFSEKGYKVSLISQNVSMGNMDYTFATPTAVDNAGNFYYCSSDDNPYGFLWLIRRVDKQTGQVSEICRLNLDLYKYGYIRAINFTADGSLYIWLALRKSGTEDWEAALVEIRSIP